MKRVNNYMKNVMKSVTYAAADIASDYTPGMQELKSSNQEFIKSTYAALKNPKAAIKRSVEAIQESKTFKALDYGAKNLVEDLRTGNFYNKERKDRDELRLSGLDFDMDDLSQFGIDDDWESKVNNSSSSSDSGITAGDMRIVNSIEGSNAALASATVNAVIRTSNSQIRAGRANMGMIYVQNEKLFGGLHNDISILNNTMNEMYKMQAASLQNIDKNMSNFFTSEAKLSAERNAILKEMLEMQRNQYKSAIDKERESKLKKTNKVRWSDVNVNGMVDFDAYFKNVQKNISNQLSSMIGMEGFGEDGNLLATFMTSPLEGAVKAVVNGVIPATVKAAAKEFDGTLSGIFGTLMGKMANAKSNDDGGLLGILSKFLGINTGVNKSIDTSRYEKGPVPFDGITRKAIIEVIPTYLRRIEAAISGRPEQLFDYKSGKWTKGADLKKQYDEIHKNAIKSGTSEVREMLNPSMAAMKNGAKSRSEAEAMEKAWDEFYQFLMDNNGIFNPKVSAFKNGVSSSTYPNFYKYYNAIRKAYAEQDVVEQRDNTGKVIRSRNTKNRVRMQLAGNVLSAKEREEQQYRDIELDPTSPFYALFSGIKFDEHGKWKGDNKNFKAFNRLSNEKDELGNNIFNYLQNINKELTWVRLNLPNMTFSAGRGRRKATDSVTGTRVSFDSINLMNASLKNANDAEYRNKNNDDEKIRRAALEKIKSGKAVDLSVFSEDEQEYLLALAELMRNSSAEEYKSELEGYNAGGISSWMNKNVYKANIRTRKDLEEAIRKANKEGKNIDDEKMDQKEEKFFQKIMKRVNAGGDIIGGVVGAAADSFTNVLYAADKAVYEMFYKTEIQDEEDKTKYKGFMDMMAHKMSDTFKDIKEKFKKDILDPFKERFGITEENKKRFKEGAINTLGSIWGVFKDSNKSIYGPLLDKMREGEFDYEEYGRQQSEAARALTKEERDRRKNVRRGLHVSDIATSKITNKDFARAISNGTKEWGAITTNSVEANDSRRVRNLVIRRGGDELEEWCRANGFTGSLDEKKVRLGNEFGLPATALAKIKTDEDANLVFAKQYRHNAKGTSGKPFMGISALTKGEGLLSNRGFGVVPKTGVYNVTTPTHIINTEDMHTLSGGKGTRVSVQQALGKEKLAAKAAGYKIASHAGGTGMKITNDGVDIDTNAIMSEAKRFIPEAAGGGLVGGILSLVLGLAGGPILGAAVGAAGTIVSKSDTLKDMLFGKAGEDGKRDGTGIVSKTIMDTVNKYAPDALKYGMAGVIPGLLTPLGPVGGLLVGGAIGVLKNNEKFTNKYFGEEGKLTIGSKEKKILEKMFPAAAKGAAIGTIAGFLLPTPFGFLGNAMFGSAIGMMTATDEFKDLILGKEINGERFGGVLGAIKDALNPFTNSLKNVGEKLSDAFEANVISPLQKFIKPAIHALPIALGAVPRFLGKQLDKHTQGIRRTVGGKVKDVLGRPAKIVAGGMEAVAGGVGKVLSVPGKIIGGAGDKLREYDIRNGDFVDMNQVQAVAWMDSHKRGDKVSSTLRASSKVGSGADDSMTVEDAEAMAKYLDRMNDSESTARKNLDAKNKALNNLLDNYTTKDGTKLSKKQINGILDAADRKEFGDISRILQSDGTLTKSEFNKFMDEGGLKKAVMDAHDAKSRLKNITDIGSTDEAAKGLNEMLEKFNITDDFDWTNKKERAKFSALLKDRLVELQANPDEIKEKREEEVMEENNKNIITITDKVSAIAKFFEDMTNMNNEATKDINEQTQASLEAGQRFINGKYDKNIESAKKDMGKDEASKLTPEGEDRLSSEKTSNRAYKYTADIVNNATGGMGNFNKAQGLFRKGATGILGDLSKAFTPEGVKYVSNLSKTKLKTFNTWVNKKFIKKTILNGKFKITDKTVEFMTKTVNNKQLYDNCRFLSQIYNKPTGKGIYSRFESLEAIGMLDDIALQELREEFGVNDSDATSSFTTNAAGVAGRTAKGVAWGTGAVVGGLAGAGKEIVSGTAKTAGKGARYVRGARSDEWYSKHAPAEEAQPEAEQNGLGTLLLSGAGKLASGTLGSVGNLAMNGIGAVGKLAGGLLGGVGKLAGGLLGSIFGKNKKDSGDENSSKALGAMAGLLGLNSASASSPVLSSGEGFEETDKKGDGKDVVSLGDGMFGQVRRDSSGNVELDGSDSATKNAMNKIALKEKAQEKLRDAQLKACEIIKSNFDTSAIKESKGGKIGWLGLLLMGGLLAKTGVLKKIYEGVIEPIWTNGIKPWAEKIWTEKLKPFLTEDVPNWIMNTAIPWLGKTFGGILNTAIQGLPAILSGGGSVIGGILDYVVGNKNNAGASTSGSISKDAYDGSLVDENGKTLSYDDIINKNYNTAYNEQGAEVQIDEDGNFTVQDESVKGSNYLSALGKGASRAFNLGMMSGKQSKIIQAASKVTGWLGKHGTTLTKFGGKIGNFFTKPLEFANKKGVNFSERWGNFTDSIIDKALGKNTAEETALAVIDNVSEQAADSAIGKALKNGAEDIAQEAVETATKKGVLGTIGDFFKGVGSKIQHGAGKALNALVDAVKKVIDKFCNSWIVKDALSKVAKTLKIDDVTGYIAKFRSKANEVFETAVKKACDKLGENAVKQLAKTVLAAVTAGIDFTVALDQAESILEVRETSFMEELIAGLINTVIGLIPVINMFSDWIIKQLFSFFGEDYDVRHAEAEAYAEQYNAEHQTTYSTAEILKYQNSVTGKVEKAVGDFVKPIGDAAVGAGKAIYNGGKAAVGWIGDRGKDIANFFGWGGDDEVESNAEGTMTKGWLNTTTISKNPIHNLFNKGLKGLANIMGDPIKILANANEFKTLDSIMAKAKEGKISVFSKEFWKNDDIKDNSVAGILRNVLSKFTRFMSAPMLMVKSSLESLYDDINVVGNAMIGKTNAATSSKSITSSSKAVTTSPLKKSTGFLSKVKTTFGSAVSKIKSFFGFGSGPDYQYGTGMYSKQIDPDVAGIRFNTSSDSEYQTIGNSGCGPAAAVNALESIYGRGNAVADAARFALNHGYKETDGGTKPGFFTDYFNRNGLGAQTSYNKSQIERNINSGLPTVIMGRNAKGTSSASPFGSTPHYVTVTGTDGHGNAIVQDPESKYDNQLYPVKSLMKNTSLGVSAFGKRYGMGMRPDRFAYKNKRITRWGTGKGTIIFIGDSRTVGMKSAVGNNSHIWSCKVGMGLNWMKSTGVPDVESQIDSNKAVVILMGVNDCDGSASAKRYAAYINDKASDWVSKGAEVYFVSINPVDESKYHGAVTNAKIDEFNSTIKTALSSNVKYIDTNSQIKSSMSSSDGLHYNNATYKEIYNIITNAVATGVSASTTLTSTSSSTSSSITTSNANDNSAPQTPTVVSMFSDILMNSKAGKALGLFIGTSNNDQQSSNTTSNNTSSSSSSSSTNKGSFPKYDLNDQQIKGIANILQHEQPGLSGMLAEASLMANLTDMGGDDKATTENLVRKATSGWFAYGSSRFNNPGTPSAEAIKAAKAVLLNGKRTVPRYVDEHDCFSDLSSVTTDGKSNTISDRSGYVQHKTKINNRYGSSYTFWGFPNSGADPFGYTSDANRQKWGDDCFSAEDATSGLGRFKRRKHGRGKWGRGTEDQIWYYLRHTGGMTEEGAAGLMGNLEAESGMRPNNAENGYEYLTGNDEEYTKKIDSGQVSRFQFAHPWGDSRQCGYGLAQWTSAGRKEGLYDLVKERNVSIADLKTQLDWLMTELNKSYAGVYSVLKSTNSLQAASDKVLGEFEIPANWRSQSGTRASMGQKWLNKFKGTEGEQLGDSTTMNNSSSGDSDSETTQQNSSPTIIDMMTNILAESKVGKALHAFIGGNTGAAPSGSDNNSSGSTASGDAAEVVKIAKEQVGIKESPVNVCKYNDWYYGHHVNGDAYPWCAAFTSWVTNEAGVPTSIMPKDAYTVTAYQTLVNRGGKISNSEARPGDIIYFTKNGAASGIYHTGIITDNSNGVISTVEGNSGNAVKEHTYNVSSGKVLCARPQYKNTSNNTSTTTSTTTNSSETKTAGDAPDVSNTRGGNGNKPLSRYGQYRDTIYGRGSERKIKNRGVPKQHLSREGYTKVDVSTFDTQLGNALKTANRPKVYKYGSVGLGSGPAYGKGTSPDYSKLINSIIKILMTIADNTDKLNIIVSILNNKLGANITASDVSDQNAKHESLKSKLASSLNNVDLSKFNNAADQIGDNSINSIISAMNAIASE